VPINFVGGLVARDLAPTPDPATPNPPRSAWITGLVIPADCAAAYGIPLDTITRAMDDGRIRVVRSPIGRLVFPADVQQCFGIDDGVAPGPDGNGVERAPEGRQEADRQRRARP
jgi:hypothetical protein